MRPVLYLSHGSPSLTLIDHPARDFLAALGERLPCPQGALVISAHYETPGVVLGTAPAPATWHDFHGFPKALYETRYPARGLPRQATALAEALQAAHIDVRLDAERVLDHGIWSPLSLVWPRADVPLMPVSVPMALTEAQRQQVAIELGRFVEREGLWLIGSGAATHNLGDRRAEGSAPAPWARAFHDWARTAAERGDITALQSWRESAPHAAYAHPTAEHFLPLAMCVAALEGRSMETLHESFMQGNISMLCLLDADTAGLMQPAG